MRSKEGFECSHCHKFVSYKAWGTKNRNHCPYCLYSLHVDVNIGDRNSICRGEMAPIGKYYRENGEEVLVHKCATCGELRKNRVAGDDNEAIMADLPIIEL